MSAREGYALARRKRERQRVPTADRAAVPISARRAPCPERAKKVYFGRVKKLDEKCKFDMVGIHKVCEKYNYLEPKTASS